MSTTSETVEITSPLGTGYRSIQDAARTVAEILGGDVTPADIEDDFRCGIIHDLAGSSYALATETTEAAASRGRVRCAHGRAFPQTCDTCDADQRNDYRMGAL